MKKKCARPKIRKILTAFIAKKSYFQVIQAVIFFKYVNMNICVYLLFEFIINNSSLFRCACLGRSAEIPDPDFSDMWRLRARHEEQDRNNR